jgi:hypothetical protein
VIAQVRVFERFSAGHENVLVCRDGLFAQPLVECERPCLGSECGVVVFHSPWKEWTRFVDVFLPLPNQKKSLTRRWKD